MLLFTLLVTGIIALLTGSVYFFAKQGRVDAFDKRLKARANNSAQVYSLMGDSAFRFLSRMDTTSSSVGILASRSIGMYSENGKRLYLFEAPGTPPLQVTDDLLNDV